MPLLEPRAPYRPRHRSAHHPLGLLTIGATLGVLVVGVSVAAPTGESRPRSGAAAPVHAGPAVVRLTDQPAFTPLSAHVAASGAHAVTVTPSPAAVSFVPQGPAQPVASPHPRPNLPGSPPAPKPKPTTSPTHTPPSRPRPRASAPVVPVPPVPTSAPVVTPVPTPTQQPPVAIAPPSPTVTWTPTTSEPTWTPEPDPTPTPTDTDCPDPEPTGEHHHHRHHWPDSLR